MDRKLTSGIIKLVAALVFFAFALVVFFAVYNRYERVPIGEADIRLTDCAVRNDAVYLQWNCNNTYLTSYNIYRSDNKAGLKFLTSNGSSKRSYLDEDIADKNHYAYAVKAFNSQTEDSVKASPDSDYIYVYVDKKAVADDWQIVSEPIDSGVLLKWDYYPNQPLTDCCILKKSGDEWVEISAKDAHLTSYRLIDAKPGDVYKVRLSLYLDGECTFTVDSNEVQL